ncbi:O-antigen ligase family protein [Sphingobium sp. WCS2017Hpa-17]|uniref:O-antigen ligase family protein n=1 Tax=Sphingobium sp. WCS2017Hpa-17 TaxID=3073638 RepID=UPI00288C22FE|nr:O-antigen ligase family protein [Sphingobium sp. WCS2017Hpa-17]
MIADAIRPGRALMVAGSASAAALVVAAGLSSGRAPALAAVGALALGGALWASGNPRLACLWGVGLTAPLGIAKRFHPMPHMGGAGAYAIEAVDLFLIALLFFQWRDARHGGPRMILPPLAYGWIAMILLGLIDALTGPYRQLALVEAVQMVKSLALFLLLIGELTRVRRFLHLFAALALGLGLQAVVGIAQYAKKGDIGLQFLGEATMTTLEYANRATYMDGGATFRIGGLLGHPNILAGYIAMLAPMLLAMLMTRLSMARKLAIGALLATALLALLLTLSRSGWLAFALAVPIVMGLMLRERRSRQRALAGSMVALATGLAGALAFAPAIVRRFTQSDPGAVDFRWDWMGVAWAMVRDHPLLGVGLNSFVLHLPGRTIHGGPDGLTRSFGANWPVVHDIYLLIWAEQGTIGFACFVMLLLGLLRTAWSNARHCADPLLFALNAGALAGLCANLLDGFGSFFLRQMPGARLFWILAAIIVAIQLWQRRNGRVA